MVSGSEDPAAPRVYGRTRSHRLSAGPTGSGAAQAQRQAFLGGRLQRASPSPGGPELTQEAPWRLAPSFLTRCPCRKVVQGGFSRRERTRLVSSALPREPGPRFQWVPGWPRVPCPLLGAGAGGGPRGG